MSKILDFFFKDKRHNHNFDNDDRELSNQIRKQKLEVAQKKQELELELLRLETERKKIELETQIAEAKDLYADLMEPENNNSSDNNSMDNMLMMLLTKFMTGGNAVASPVANIPQPVVNLVSLNDEQIEETFKKIPSNYIKIAKSMDDVQLVNLIKGQIPNISEETLNKAIIKVRNS